MIFLRLFYEFFKVGLFAIGGGMATIPFLADLSEKTGWFTSQQLADMIAVSESTPGPIGVNMATYVGFSTAGVFGGIVSTLGLVTPSVIVIILVIQILKKFNENPIVKSVFSGLRPASLGLIAAAFVTVAEVSLINADTWSFGENILKLFNFKSLALAVVIFFMMKKIKVHPIFYILGSAVVGILFNFSI